MMTVGNGLFMLATDFGFRLHSAIAALAWHRYGEESDYENQDQCEQSEALARLHGGHLTVLQVEFQAIVLDLSNVNVVAWSRASSRTRVRPYPHTACYFFRRLSASCFKASALYRARASASCPVLWHSSSMLATLSRTRSGRSIWNSFSRSELPTYSPLTPTEGVAAL